VLAAAPFPQPAALAREAGALEALRAALARDPVTTDLRATLARPPQRELDAIVGRALGLSAAAVEETRRALVERLEARLAHAAAVRGAIGQAARERPATARKP
jgi:hypothetical protein